jgi:hypothetical protein
MPRAHSSDRDDTSDQQPTDVCATCRVSVPTGQITVLMGRRVCLACAAMMYGEEDDEDEE